MNKQINTLLNFIPDGYPMPLGFEQVVKQVSDSVAFWTGECERLRRLCYGAKGDKYKKLNDEWNVAAKYLEAARFEKEFI